ncbi:MAG: hypothetical protein F9K32_17480 [Desulfobulbaceae bacterium]|nr:MAG: hypothetical protein F9K32_17480 [Desulfobulbaceae bacterium]
MKKWHMEGIVNAGTPYGRRLVVVPEEDQMYSRIRGYASARRKENALIGLLRKIAGWLLSFI